jgi:hypothetical protein
MFDRQERSSAARAADDRTAAESRSVERVVVKDVEMVPLQSIGSASDQQPVSFIGWSGAMLIGAAMWIVILAQLT